MQNLDRPSQKTALEEFNRDLMGRLRDYQLSLQVADHLTKAAAEERDQAVTEANARVEAMQAVIAALLRSLRPFGLDRKRFVAAIRTAAESVPAHGPQSVQHTVLHTESMRVLRRD
jgi:ribosomal protein L16 Arg81 hydroxylase